jgi:hypothetical protein
MEKSPSNRMGFFRICIQNNSAGALNGKSVCAVQLEKRITMHCAVEKTVKADRLVIGNQRARWCGNLFPFFSLFRKCFLNQVQKVRILTPVTSVTGSE